MVAIAGNSTPAGYSLAAGAVFVGLAATFGDDDGPVLCMFRRCTGGYCPGCGGSRAVVAAARGDLAGAWAANPWALFVIAQVLVASAVAIGGYRSSLRQMLVPVLSGNIVLGVGIWIARLFAGAIPIPFG